MGSATPRQVVPGNIYNVSKNESREQASKQMSSMASALVPDSSFCSVLTSLNEISPLNRNKRFPFQVAFGNSLSQQ